MVEYKTKLLDSSKFLDTSEYNIFDKFLIDIPSNILNLERNILPKALPDLYIPAIYKYGKKEPFLNKHLCISNDSTEVPKTLIELENNFKINPNLEYFYTDKDGIPIKRFLDLVEYDKIKNFLTETPSYLIFTEELLKSLEAFYMLHLNNEKDVVNRDFTNISSHITLIDTEYENIGDMDSFLNYYNFNGLGFDIVKYEYLIFYMDIMNLFKNKNPLSVSLKIVSNSKVLVEFFASPSSRRYNINKKLTIEDLLD